MNIETVQWRKGAKTAGIDAGDAYRAIEEIRQSRGDLTPEDVVEASRPKGHTLHDYFEWNDRKAASEFRLVQSRTLLRSIEVVYAEKPKAPVRAYEIASQKTRGDSESRTLYLTNADAMADPTVRDRLIADAIKHAMEFRRRFTVLAELREVFEAIDNFVTAVADDAVS